ncbi:hypothetical protein [Sorangium sp. So ce1078]|uniref:hypothetical protein n=1 Tax=Sorangium sp. So ce1078 TaxID=3133329 RepID=UPI003F5DEE53
MATRIRGLTSAASFLFGTLHGIEGDLHDSGDRFLIANAMGILEYLKEYRSAHATQLPPTAIAALDRFLAQSKSIFDSFPPKGLAGVQGTVTALTSFELEFTHLIRDHDSVARRLTERALVHLQRSIIVDDDMSAKWRKAYSRDEPDCERLGAIHLLAHGIWAFKASAEGARTDLILGEPLSVTPQVRETAEALVLTEWKLVRSPVEVEPKSQQALAQASQYSSGILAGFELATTRYLIIVSGDSITMPTDVVRNGVHYRYINIPVEPSVPSKSKAVRR